MTDRSETTAPSQRQDEEETAGTAAPWTPVPLARGARGAVVAPHHLATAAGLHVLRLGGTAVDAAIATNAVLAVVMPNGCGIGGDAFWLLWDEAAGTQSALNGSGRAAAAADPRALRDRGLDRIPKRGGLSITVPGAVRSWGDAHDRHGRLSRDTILAPAMELARDGFPAWDGFIASVEGTGRQVRDAIGPDAAFFQVYRPDGRPWRPGELVRLPALARTLERLALDGWATFYEGELGERQARALAAADSPIEASDLRDHRSTWETPIGLDYRGVRVTTHPPNSSGVTALELLGILSQFDAPPSGTFGPQGVTDARWIHLGLEAAKLAMADRDAFLTDPAFRDVPVGRLLDPAYHETLSGRIDPARAARPPAATNPRGGGTIFLGVVDGEGNAVALIESNYLGFGSGVVDPETGIHYHDRGSYFSLEPDHPNILEPGKRTLHTLLPGMLFRPAGDGRLRPWIVTGQMGGDAQPQILAQLVSALVDGGVDVRTAVAAPRWFIEPPDHFEAPEAVHIEPRHAAGIEEQLVAMGHGLAPTAPFDGNLGHAHAIELVDDGPAVPGGSLAAATDPRSHGLPAVW